MVRLAMRTVYGLLSLLGLILPMVCFGIHFGSSGEGAWGEFFAAPFATWVISGFSWDLMITATASAVWMGREAKRLGMRGYGWHFLAIFVVGMCFALPTFLYRRERYLNRGIADMTELGG